MKFIVSLLLISSCILQTATAQEKWDLRRCVEYALANNISVKQADIDARRADLTLKQSQLSQYPTANFSSNAGINSGRSINPTTNQFTQQQLFSSGFNIQSGVTVFNWFSIKNQIAANQLDADAARTNIEKLRNDISLNVATAYLLVLVSQEQANIANVAVQQTLQNLDNTSKRVEAGALPELNLAEIEAQLARDSSSLISAQNSVLQNILSLKALLTLDASQSFAVDMPPLDKIPVESLAELQPEVVYALAMANLPQQKLNDLRIKAANKFVEVSKAQMYPSITMFGNLASNYANNKVPVVSVTPTGNYKDNGSIVTIAGNNYNVMSPEFNTIINTTHTAFGTQLKDNFRQNIGIGLNVPIFNGGSAKIGWKRSILNVKSLELVKQQADLTLKNDIYKSYTDAVSSIQQYNASLKGVETAEKAYNFAEKRYQLGLLSTIDFLTNQNNLTRAKVQKAQAQVDYVFRLKLLEFYKGQGIKL